jgi:hypothetical protein
MRDMGLAGVIRGKPVRTTISDKAAPCPLDRVNRQKRSSTPRWNGSTGLTIGGCSSLSAMSHPQKPNNATMTCWTTSPWPRNLNQIASGDPGAVHYRSSRKSESRFNQTFRLIGGSAAEVAYFCSASTYSSSRTARISSIGSS